MGGQYKLQPAEQVRFGNLAGSAGRSLYGPSMSYLLGFQTKYVWNHWSIPVHPAQLVLLYLSTLFDSWLAHCVVQSEISNHWITFVKHLVFEASEIEKVTLTLHVALIRNLIKLKGTAKLTVQGEQVCLKNSRHILFEILENRRWKGYKSSC